MENKKRNYFTRFASIHTIYIFKLCIYSSWQANSDNKKKKKNTLVINQKRKRDINRVSISRTLITRIDITAPLLNRIESLA